MPDRASQLEELIRRAARGDGKAFTKLYDQTAAQLFGVALRMTGRREIAEDALQECFMSAWQSVAAYDPTRGTAMTWLMTIMRNCAIDRLRRLGTRPEGHLASEELLDKLAGTDRSDRGAELHALQRCLDELDELPRKAVILAYLYGLTRDELAAHFAVPLGTAKSWIRRSLVRLQRCLDA